MPIAPQASSVRAESSNSKKCVEHPNRNQTTVHFPVIADSIVRAERSPLDGSPRKKGALLYISDPGANVVGVFTFPDGTRAGTLTGFNQPSGLCVDASNNMYVSNSGSSNVLEFARGGTSPTRTVDGPEQQPYDCAANRIPSTAQARPASVADADARPRSHATDRELRLRLSGTSRDQQ